MDLSWKYFESITYTNEKSETYIVVFVDGFPNRLHTEIVDLCSNELFITENLSKAQKSNLYVIVASRVEGNISEKQFNHIYMIEENNLYYKKYFFWYRDDEVDALNNMLENDFTSSNMNKNLVNYKHFSKFKENDLGYSLLSRLYIKFAFLTLFKIETLNKTLAEYIEESVNQLNISLYDNIVKNFDVSDSLDSEIDLIVLSDKELSDIDRQLDEVSL